MKFSMPRFSYGRRRRYNSIEAIKLGLVVGEIRILQIWKMKGKSKRGNKKEEEMVN